LSDIEVVVNRELNVGWFPLIIVTLAAFIISIDLSFLNVSITNLVHDLNTTVVTVQNIIIVYAAIILSHKVIPCPDDTFCFYLCQSHVQVLIHRKTRAFSYLNLDI